MFNPCFIITHKVIVKISFLTRKASLPMGAFHEGPQETIRLQGYKTTRKRVTQIILSRRRAKNHA